MNNRCRSFKSALAIDDAIYCIAEVTGLQPSPQLRRTSMIRTLITGIAACALMTGAAFAQDAGRDNSAPYASAGPDAGGGPAYANSGPYDDGGPNDGGRRYDGARPGNDGGPYYSRGAYDD